MCLIVHIAIISLKSTGSVMLHTIFTDGSKIKMVYVDENLVINLHHIEDMKYTVMSKVTLFAAAAIHTMLHVQSIQRCLLVCLNQPPLVPGVPATYMA